MNNCVFNSGVKKLEKTNTGKKSCESCLMMFGLYCLANTHTNTHKLLSEVKQQSHIGESVWQKCEALRTLRSGLTLGLLAVVWGRGGEEEGKQRERKEGRRKQTGRVSQIQGTLNRKPQTKGKTGGWYDFSCFDESFSDLKSYTVNVCYSLGVFILVPPVLTTLRGLISSSHVIMKTSDTVTGTAAVT